MAAGALAWVGAATQNTGVSFSSMIEAGINIVPPALFLLGLGALVHASLPRYAPTLVYAVIVWSFLVQLIGSIVNAPHWLLDTSVTTHVNPTPAASPDWTAAAALVGLGCAAAAAAAAIFSRRDLVGA